MVDLIRRSFLIGLGALSLTRDRLEHFVNESVARGELSSEQGKSLLDEMTDRAEQQQQKLESFVRSQVDRCLEVAGLTPRSEVDRLEGRVDRLETRLRDLSARIGESETEAAGGPGSGIYVPPGVAPITVDPPASALDPTDPDLPPGA